MVNVWRLSIKCRRLRMCLVVDDLVSGASFLPPGQCLEAPRKPPGFGHGTNPCEVTLAASRSGPFVESNENSRNVDEVRRAMPDELPMSAIWVVGRILDDTGRYRIEMHVGYDLPQVITRIDDPCPISTLPEPPEISSPPFEFPCNDGLNALH
jgi:hypothetical protein